MARKDKKETQTISIRFPVWMYKTIKDMADEHYRSINYQVVYLLKQALRQRQIEAIESIEEE